MKIKTADLIGPALDWAVAKCEYADKHHAIHIDVFNKLIEVDALPYGSIWRRQYNPSADWAQGGPISERAQISVASPSPICKKWTAMTWANAAKQDGPTELIAKMRCVVASKLGDEVEIPEELK